MIWLITQSAKLFDMFERCFFQQKSSKIKDGYKSKHGRKNPFPNRHIRLWSQFRRKSEMSPYIIDLLVGTNGCDYLMQWPWNSLVFCTVSVWFQAIDFLDACQWGELNSATLPPDLNPHVICRYCHGSLCSCREIKVEVFEFTFIRCRNLHTCLIKKDFVWFGLWKLHFMLLDSRSPCA